MKAIHLLGVETEQANLPTSRREARLGMLDELSAVLARVFQVSCHVREEYLDADFAFDPARGQYHSTAILQRMQSLAVATDICLLGVTDADLYVPVLTFVYGEAQLAGSCALVSSHRLRDEFYGLPPNCEVFRERVAKEAVHELGHTLGLRHCFDWRCVMASSHNVERIDSKSGHFCAACLRSASLPGAGSESESSNGLTGGSETKFGSDPSELFREFE